MGHQPLRLARSLSAERLEPRVVLSGTSLVINEFMADNDTILADVDGDYSDWIEIHNPTDRAVDLDGWHLTDAAGELTKWEFPARSILPGEFLLVFASDKDRTDPDAELHTNFKLGSSEYLALVEPDGVTISHHFAPAYPGQSSDVSYGLSRGIRRVLLDAGAELAYRVPTAADEPLGDTWNTASFDDTPWNPIEEKSPLLITEVGTEDPDFVEIQNVTAGLIETAGWVVAVNDGVRANVNSMHAFWELPEWIGPQDVLYRHDDPNTPENFWGEEISWRTVGTGWVMVVDADGGVVDSVVWGYPPEYLDGLNLSINGQTITVEDLDNDQIITSGGTSANSLQRQGDMDRDRASDWQYTVPPSPGSANAGIELPFAMPSAPTGGVGFSSAGGAEFDASIESDVRGEMHGQNASLWTRIPLQIDDPDQFGTLELHVQYNDGFVAYLNGQRIAARNAPGVPLWNSSATDRRSVAESLVYDEINVTSYLPALQPGLNVLAIHGLNYDASDENFLISAKLTATSYRAAEQFFTSPTPGEANSAGFIVINEAHYDPADNTQRAEFIELHNTTPDTIDLSGWRFDDGVRFTFPEGTTLDGGRYLVVAEHPTTIKSVYGIDALGPWIGGLGNDGERILLIDELEHEQDRVRYKDEFPWPVAARGGGSSMELIHPALDNDLGGSWRPSGYNTLTKPGGTITAANARPTPGRRNSVYATESPPQIRQVLHDPVQPAVTDSVTITAKVTDGEGVGSVVLAYQVVEPGDYVGIADNRYTNPAYWTTVAMADDGQHGDGAANDDVYGVVLPPAAATNRSLVRYRITADDTAGRSITAPHMDDSQPNFAYFVYDGVPSWTGADRPGSTAPVTFDADVMGQLPAYHLIADADDVIKCQYNNQYQEHRFRGTMVYAGEVYDHIEYRVRGEFSTYVSGKNKWKFFFNRSHAFQARNIYGQPYAESWRTMNFVAASTPWMPVNRGMAGIGESLAYALFDLAGVPSSRMNPLQFRVIDGAVEANPANQYEGDLWGLYWTLEHPDGRFLDERSLPDGNVYKIEGGRGDKKHQGATQTTSTSDVSSFMSAYGRSQSIGWWRANVDLDTYYSFRGVGREINNMDIREGWNVYYYHNSATDSWVPIPWDLDMLYAPTTHWSGVINMQNAIKQHAELNREYQARGRELQDLLFTEDQLALLIGEYAAAVNPPGEPWTMVDVDQFMWNYHPRTAGSHRGAFYRNPADSDPWNPVVSRTLVSADHEGMAQWILDFMQAAPGGGSSPPAYGYNFLSRESTDAAIPDTPTVAYAGSPGFPLNDLAFQTTAFEDPQGDQTFGAMQWRVAEVTDPDAPAYDPDLSPVYEIDAVWESPELTTFGDLMHVPGGALELGHTYRARVRMQDETGRWSHWSDPVEFTTAAPTVPVLDALKITEVMYHPLDPTPAELAQSPHAVADDFEFIELQNTSNAPLDLPGFEFTDGVDLEFTFDAAATLAPGGYAVVVRDPAAFALRYGDEVNVAGTYQGGLKNDGEWVTLLDPYGRTVHEFAYNDTGGWSGRADGKGASLEVIDPDGDYADPDTWRASVAFGGTPGGEPAADPGVVISEVLTRTDAPAVDAIELHNPTVAPIDVGGWYLSDDWGMSGNPRNDDYEKFRIPDDTVIPAGGFTVFYEGRFEDGALAVDQATEFGGLGAKDFALNGAEGDDVWLIATDPAGNAARFADHVEFPAAVEGESFGRVGDVGKLAPMAATTLGEPNAAPRIGSVVISEVMYQQGDDGVEDWNAPDDSLEFIELHNTADVTVELFDPADRAQTWRFANVGFSFPGGVSMAPGETLLVVPGDPDDFELKYAVAPGVRIFGPYSGVLDNSGERLRLMRPVAPSAAVPHVVPYVIEDEVDYEPDGAWPATDPQLDPPEGAKSLQRTAGDAWGDDPGSWIADVPTPGEVPWAATTPRVVGRHVFYNNSAFDGNDPAAGVADDAAIAPDKQALRPGEGAALANYTSYSLGLNGVMIDVADAAVAITPEAFRFRGGNGNPATWSDATAPTSFTVRAGAGIAGSDRVTLIWDDHTIKGRWLEVTVVGSELGMAEDDVFAFGNAVAEAGNSPTNAQVTTTDLLLARNNPRNFLQPAEIDFAYDYNRDQRVSATDVLLARNNQTNFLTALALIDLPGG